MLKNGFVIGNIVLRAAAVFCLLAAFSIAQQPAEKQPLAPGSPQDLVQQGDKLEREGKLDDALALYGRALDKSPDLYEAHLSSGIALDLKGNYSDAREHLAKAIEVAPADSKPQALRAMAISYAFEGDTFKAAGFETQVLNARLAKNDSVGAAELCNELGRIYLEAGDPDHAEKWYKMAYNTIAHKSDLNDADKNLWLFRWENAQARIAARRGKADEARQHVAAAKDALDKANNPDQMRFYPYLTGYVAFYTGDYKTAIAELQKADQHDPATLALLGEAYEKLGDAAQAKTYYQKVLEAYAHNPANAFARPLATKKLNSGG
ncbi:MAG TPA: tetratricopeptide repeat protein [Candidatus Sulfotelmatobacter sp.]|jgi:tetratricopeptide (TPR) repeat protein